MVVVVVLVFLFFSCCMNNALEVYLNVTIFVFFAGAVAHFGLVRVGSSSMFVHASNVDSVVSTVPANSNTTQYNCNCNWGMCIAPSTGRPRAHHIAIISLYSSVHILEQKCFQSTMKRGGRSLQLCRQPVPYSRCGDRKSCRRFVDECNCPSTHSTCM